MAKPQQVINQNNGGPIIYPLDLDSQPYFASMHFVKYIRPIFGEATYQPQGNIFLPLPIQIPESYSIRYDQRGLGLFGNEINEWWKVGQTIKADIRNSFGGMDINGLQAGKTEAWSALGRDITSNYSKYAAMLTPNYLRDSAIGAPINRLAQALGAIQNPHMAIIFDGVNLRRHTFTWSFSPRTQTESIRLRDMINTLRRNSHPTYTPGLSRFTLDFPYQVYMNFVGSDFIYPVKRSVIENIVVDNTEGGEPIWYKGGAPVFIGLRIELSEVEILTQADFNGDISWTNAEYSQAGVTSSIPVGPTGPGGRPGGGV